MPVETAEWAEATSSSAEHRVQHEDDQPDDAEPASAGDDGPTHPAATDVRDLGRVEFGTGPEAHRDRGYPETGTLRPRP